ncbi:unnamed protein product [Lampetra planeri]
MSLPITSSHRMARMTCRPVTSRDIIAPEGTPTTTPPACLALSGGGAGVACAKTAPDGSMMCEVPELRTCKKGSRPSDTAVKAPTKPDDLKK